jgi:hypothetical protein
MNISDVSAVIVTRGDVDLTSVLESLFDFGEVIVWDNSKQTNLKVFGRYRAALNAKNDVVFTQDDDCVLDAAQVVSAYEPGKVVCNMPVAKRAEYASLGCNHISLVGWGACFHRGLIHKMHACIERYGLDDLFLRECDRVFTAANELKLVDVPFRHLPHAYRGRMGNEARHLGDLANIRDRIAVTIRHE